MSHRLSESPIVITRQASWCQTVILCKVFRIHTVMQPMNPLHAWIQRGWGGGAEGQDPPPEKSQKYRVS